jgi:hypothetical protein
MELKTIRNVRIVVSAFELGTPVCNDTMMDDGKG